MVTICDIERRHLGKLVGDGLHISLIANHPELMTETVDRSNEVIDGLCLRIAHNQRIERAVIRICKEYGLNIGIVHTDMLHAVFLLVTTRQLVLLDTSLHIVVNQSTYHQTILRLTVHGLCVDIIVVVLILYQPAFVLEHLEVLCGLFIDTRIIFRCTHREIYLRLDDMIQTFLVVASLSTGFLRIQYVIRTALYLFYKLFWWTNATEWFYCCHRFITDVLLTERKGNQKFREHEKKMPISFLY